MKKKLAMVSLLVLASGALADDSAITNTPELIVPYGFSNGLVAHYTFDGNANDSSGNGNDGILRGVTLTADRHGNVNGAYHFNGTSSYIEVPDSDSLREVGQTVTVSVWVNAESWHNSGWIVTLDKGNRNSRQYGSIYLTQRTVLLLNH